MENPQFEISGTQINMRLGIGETQDRNCGNTDWGLGNPIAWVRLGKPELGVGVKDVSD